jgi:hypothetical protein
MALLFSPYFRASDQSNLPISGAFLSFYQTQTSTPQPIWADVNLTIPLQNPLPSDSNGIYPAIWLDDSLPPYKVTLKYPDVNDPTIPGAIVSGPNGTLDPYNSPIDYTFLAANLWPQNATENALGLDIVNFVWPPMYVDRYGNNTNSGTTSMLAAFNAACKIGKQVSGVVRYGATGLYLLDGPVDCTTGPGQVPSGLGFTIRNEGSPLAITYNQPNTGSIIAKHPGYVFDCTGTNGLIFENVSISSDPAIYPKVGWFLARNTDAGSQTIHLKDCRYYGPCSVAHVYNFGSENYLQSACTFIQTALDAGCKTAIFTSHNILGLTSTLQTVAPGTQSTTVINIRDGECQNISGSITSDILYFESCSKITVDGVFLDSAPVSTQIRSLIYVDTTNGPTNTVTLRGITSEAQAHQSAYGIFIGNAAATLSNWVIDGCDLSGLTSRIFANTLVICDDFYTRCTSSDNSLGNINFAGTLQNSLIQEMATNVLVNVSTNNILAVPSNNLTVTTRSGDNWVDSGIHTWTPGTGALTHGGVLTASNKRSAYHDQRITVTLVLSDTVSLSCAAGTAITGLPIAATVGAANVIVANGSTGAVIGVGQVAGTSLILPAISVGAGVSVGITATYFCA